MDVVSSWNELSERSPTAPPIAAGAERRRRSGRGKRAQRSEHAQGGHQVEYRNAYGEPVSYDCFVALRES